MKALRLMMALSVAAGCTNRLVDDVPRLYACDRAAGLDSCPGGWRCGLSGYCQGPGQLLPYACENSDDCSAPWHCGPERVCYDRAAAQDRACRASLETIPDAGDCAPGWRCGKEPRGQVCHPLDAGAAYLCTSDFDCEGGWRCGPQGACVDVAEQGLRPGQLSLNTTRVSPLLPRDVELLQVNFADIFSGLPQSTGQAIFTAGGQLARASIVGSQSGRPTSSLEETALLRPAHALAQTQQHLLVTDSSGLVDYTDALDGGTPVVLNAALAGTELRYAPSLNRFGTITAEELVAFSGPRVALCTGTSNGFSQCDARSFQSDTLPGDINDLVFFDDAFTGRRSVLAGTSRGPYLAPRSGAFLALDGGLSANPVWRPVSLPGLSDACSGTPTAIDRLAFDERRQLLSVATHQGQQQVSFFKRSDLSYTAPCAALAFDTGYGPCAACAAGETLIRLGFDESLNADSMLTFCQRTEADAGVSVTSYRHQTLDGGCSLEPVSLPASARRGFHFSQSTAGLGGLDSVSVPRKCPLQSCTSMFSAAVPDRVAGGPGLLLTAFDDLFDAAGSHTQQPDGLSTALGLQVFAYQNLFVAGSVTERPDWLVGSTGSSATMGTQSLVIQSLSQRLSGMQVLPSVVLSRSSDLVPSLAAGGLGLKGGSTRAFSGITTDADGKPWVIIGAGDRIWAEDSRLLGEDGGVRTIGIKVVPFPSADIQSLAFAAFDRKDAGTGPLMEGYTVEQQRLFHVVVQGPALWLSDEIRLGETSTVPVAVWMEGSRGRVGTSDGRVFGLPVPVALSTTIPEAPLPTVLNYGSLCGQGFALTPSALYRLSLETPPLGTWKRVSLESVQPGLDTWGPHWGATMHKARVGTEEHLYLFSQTGLVVELHATCP